MLQNILITVAAMVGLNGLLALILALAERIFANYGDYEITINQEKKLTLKGGSSLLSTLKSQGIYLPSACGGRGTCGYCKCKITEGAGNLLPTEEPLLGETERQNQIRLACQVKLKRNMMMEIPDELFNIRQFRARVAILKDLTYDIKLLQLRLGSNEQIHFKAGQYVQLESKPYGDVKESVIRAYSICSPSFTPNYIELMIRQVPDGICTTWAHRHLREGDEVSFIGPMGDFFMRPAEGEIIMIAGGSGMAPMVSLLHDMVQTQNPRPATFFFGARTTKDLFYLDEMNELQRQAPNFRFIPALSAPTAEEEWKGETGLITDVVHRHISKRNMTQAQGYLCGSPGMVKACMAVLNKNGISNDRIFFDPFA